MGWVSSPSNFSACTETIADLANAKLRNRDEVQRARARPHRLDEVSETPPLPGGPNHIDHGNAPELPTRLATQPYQKLLGSWDIYVDDFCGLVQGSQWRRRVVKRILFEALDLVFRPLDEKDTEFRQEPASMKKLWKGDTTWTTQNILLGWLIDTQHKTITLPPYCAERLLEILEIIKPHQKTVPTKTWHKVVGELQSMVIALPGAQGLFLILQEAF